MLAVFIAGVIVGIGIMCAVILMIDTFDEDL